MLNFFFFKLKLKSINIFRSKESKEKSKSILNIPLRRNFNKFLKVKTTPKSNKVKIEINQGIQ